MGRARGEGRRAGGGLRTALVLGTNLVVGTTALAWVLRRFGGTALGLLTQHREPMLLAVLPVMVGLAFVGYAVRWRVILDGLDPTRLLRGLVAYRAAGQSLSSLIPSGRPVTSTRCRPASRSA